MNQTMQPPVDTTGGISESTAVERITGLLSAGAAPLRDEAKTHEQGDQAGEGAATSEQASDAGEQHEEQQSASDDAGDSGEQQDEQALEDGEESAQSEDGEQGEAEDSDEQSNERERKHRMEFDGKEVEVTDTELKAGYLRQQDYTRKTQDVAAKNKAAEEVRARAERVLNANAELLAILESDIGDSVPPAPPVDLLNTNPAEYLRMKEAREARIRRLNAVRSAQLQVREQQTSVAKERQAEMLRTESAKLLEAFPTWKDPKVALTQRQRLAKYAHDAGFTPAEYGNIFDHRMVKVLHDAAEGKAALEREAKARAAASQKRAATPPTPAVIKPAGKAPTSKPAGKAARREAAVKDAVRIGSEAAATRAMKHLLD